MRFILFLIVWLSLPIFVFASPSSKCYLQIKNKVDSNDLSLEISMSLLTKFVEKVVRIPLEGVPNKACVYELSKGESEGKLVIAISGPKLSGYGTSEKKGIEGLKAALLKAIASSSRERKFNVCRIYGSGLGETCSYNVQKSAPPISIEAKPIQKPESISQNMPKGNCESPSRYTDLTHCNFQKKRFVRLDLTGVKLSQVNLAKAYFKECNLSKANVEGAVLSKVKFYKTDLTGTNFSNTIMDKAKFKKSVLVGTDFSYAILIDSDFQNESLSNIDFSKTKMKDSEFEEAVLFDVSFIGADLENVEFKQAKLNNVDFTKSNLKNADFKEALLKSATFKNADLEKTILNKAASLVNIVH